MKILIVEDDVIPANYLNKMLEQEGYNVITMVKTGAKAIEVTKKEKPQLIFMDIMLKDQMSGAEAAKEIHYLYPEIMIVFLTAYSDKEMIEFAVESDAFAYLLKPYRDKEIIATLELAKAKLTINKKTQEEKKRQENCEYIIILVDGYTYDTEVKRLFLNKKEVPLSSKALKLIQLLCSNKGITLEINFIINELWETPKNSQTLRSLIHRIRELTSSKLIQNINKFGYRIGREQS